MEDARKAASVWMTQPEDALSYVLLPQVAKDFLPRKFARVNKINIGIDDPLADGSYPV